MFAYLKKYKIGDMREMMRNNRTPHLTSEVSLKGKTAVITGATSGVGLSAAEELARFGCDLVLVARNPAKAGKIGERIRTDFGVSVSVYLADFARIEEVHEVSARILAGVDTLDILISSAGIHATTKQHTDDGFELVFCVNYLSSFILTYRLIPRMKECASARIIQVNSQGHRFGGLRLDDLEWKRRPYIGLRGYGASKTAQLLSVWEFADRLSGTNVTINAMHPGAVKTNIGTNNGLLYNWYLRNIVWKSLQDVRISGESLHYLAAAPELEGVSGVYFNLTHPEKPAPHALDREVGRELWKKTLEMTGLDDDL